MKWLFGLLFLVSTSDALANPVFRNGGAAAPYAAPVPFLMGSRFVQPGQNGNTLSNGTNTGQNSIMSSFNETGATVNSVRVVLPNWFANSTNEVINGSTIIVKTAIEYPSGTCTVITCGHVGVCSVLDGSNSISDVVTLKAPIPAGSQYWVHTFVSVPSGSKWPVGYSPIGALSEAAHQSVGETDLSATCGAVSNDGSSFYAPIGVAAISMTGTHVPVALAGLGDSIIMGAGDGSNDAHGNTGWLGRAATGKVPYVNIGLTGQQAQTNLAANYPLRRDAMLKMGVTHIMVDWGINDIRLGGFTAAQTETALNSIWADLATSFKVIQSTCTVQSTTTDAWVTVANQTPLAPFNGGGAAHATLVTYEKTVPSPLEQVWDIDSVLENDPVGFDGKWPINATWANHQYTNDGLHPANLGSSTGGVFPAATYGGTQITNLVNAGG